MAIPVSARPGADDHRPVRLEPQERAHEAAGLRRHEPALHRPAAQRERQQEAGHEERDRQRHVDGEDVAGRAGRGSASRRRCGPPAGRPRSGPGPKIVAQRAERPFRSAGAASVRWRQRPGGAHRRPGTSRRRAERDSSRGCSRPSAPRSWCCAGAALLLLLAVRRTGARRRPARRCGDHRRRARSRLTIDRRRPASSSTTLDGSRDQRSEQPVRRRPEGQRRVGGDRPRDHERHATSSTIYGLPIWSGDIDNTDGKTSADGVLDARRHPADRPRQAWSRSAAASSGTGGSCSGSAWIRLAGDPLTSIPGIVGIGAGILGLVGVLSAIPGRHPFRGAPLRRSLLGLGGGHPARSSSGSCRLGALSPLGRPRRRWR